jgi:hypothetical protein
MLAVTMTLPARARASEVSLGFMLSYDIDAFGGCGANFKTIGPLRVIREGIGSADG